VTVIENGRYEKINRMTSPGSFYDSPGIEFGNSNAEFCLHEIRSVVLITNGDVMAEFWIGANNKNYMRCSFVGIDRRRVECKGNLILSFPMTIFCS
jgi:hypothetical protein